MKILITGICGFVGSALAASLLDRAEGLAVVGIDNLMRPARRQPRPPAAARRDVHAWRHPRAQAIWRPSGGIGSSTPPPISERAGRRGRRRRSRQLFEHNLAALVNVLEYCKSTRGGARAASQQQPRVLHPGAGQAAATSAEGTRTCTDESPRRGPGSLRARASEWSSRPPPRSRSTARRSWLPSDGPGIRRRLRFPGVDRPRAECWPATGNSARRAGHFSRSTRTWAAVTPAPYRLRRQRSSRCGTRFTRRSGRPPGRQIRAGAGATAYGPREADGPTPCRSHS